MSRTRRILHRSASTPVRKRGVRPVPEILEDRLLLYSKLGDQFVYSSRITYSFMPDGTSVGGVPSALFATLNAKYSTVTWQHQIEQAASIWENAANLNLAAVPDGGQAVGVSGNQQGDSRFGDIRIGAVPLASGTLGVAFLPPPANGGTLAGDILLNSSVNWQINSNYDLMTVVAHEFGHSLGLGDVSTPAPPNPTPVMYGNYNGINQALASDDIAGIRAVDGIRQFDIYNINGVRNNTYGTATNISSTVGSNAQAAIPSLDITTGGDTEWYYLTVPSTTTGTMKVTVQSSNLSSLSPKLVVYNSALSLVGQASAPSSMGATVSVSTSVLSGQGYYFKVLSAGGAGPIGGYGLLVNLGSQSQPPIAPPNTVVAEQPDGGGGSLTNAISVAGPIDPTSSSGSGAPLPVYTTIGDLRGWAEVFTTASPAAVTPVTPPDQPQSAPVSTPSSPIAPLTLINPILGTTTSANTAKHHHAKVRHAKVLRFAAGGRIRHVKDLLRARDFHTR